MFYLSIYINIILYINKNLIKFNFVIFQYKLILIYLIF